jgi:hypothetical protein
VKTTRLSESACPTCGKTLDAATAMIDATPSPGDCTICLGCQDIFIFTEELGLRRPTEQEIETLPLLDISQAQRALTEVKTRR